jgi:hypothetical protein
MAKKKDDKPRRKDRGFILEELKKLERANGRLIATDVVAAAENPKHPLHDRFNWDKEDASHKYRLHQARVLIRQVRVDVIINTHVERVVAYVRDPERPKDYRRAERLVSRKDLAKQVLLEEVGRAVAALKRARAVAVALGLTREVEKMIRGLMNPDETEA